MLHLVVQTTYTLCMVGVILLDVCIKDVDVVCIEHIKYGQQKHTLTCETNFTGSYGIALVSLQKTSNYGFGKHRVFDLCW